MSAPAAKEASHCGNPQHGLALSLPPRQSSDSPPTLPTPARTYASASRFRVLTLPYTHLCSPQARLLGLAQPVQLVWQQVLPHSSPSGLCISGGLHAPRASLVITIPAGIAELNH